MSDLFQNAPPYSGAYSRNNHVVTYCFSAAAVFIFKKVNDKVLNSMQGLQLES